VSSQDDREKCVDCEAGVGRCLKGTFSIASNKACSSPKKGEEPCQTASI